LVASRLPALGAGSVASTTGDALQTLAVYEGPDDTDDIPIATLALISTITHGHGGMACRVNGASATSTNWFAPTRHNWRPRGWRCLRGDDRLRPAHAIMLIADGTSRGSICTTNGVSELIQDLQFTLGEGAVH
jgi:hypothetical protein